MMFGKNPRKADEWSVGQCIRGQATFKEAYGDPGLGKTTRVGFRNLPKRGDETRYFGLPSIRADISKPQSSSLANQVVASSHQNYGDDPSAIEVMFPHCYTHYGLSEQDIVMRRQKEEVQLRQSD